MRIGWKGWFVVAFIAFWVFGMTTGFANGACLKGLSTPEKTARACAIGLTGLKAVYNIGQPYKDSDAELFTATAIARAQVGKHETVQALLETALDRVMLAYRRVQYKGLMVDVKGEQVPEVVLNVLQRLYAEDVPPYVQDTWWRIVERRKPELAALFRSDAEVVQ
jgi:hypothetical protein